MAIVNKWAEIKADGPAVGGGSLTFTLPANTHKLPMPAGPDRTRGKTFKIYWGDEPLRENLLDRNLYRVMPDGSLYFSMTSNTDQVFTMEYQKEPTVYDDISADILETENSRTKQYLALEIRKIYYDGLRLNEPSAAGQNMLTDANRIS